MTAFARLLYLFIGASLPAAFGCLVSAIMLLSALNDIQARSIADPSMIDGMKQAAYAPGRLGIEISLPLWIAWAVYLLFQRGDRKE